MHSRALLVTVLVVAFSVSAIVLGALAWVRVNNLTLPLPVALPAVNVFIPVASAIVWTLARKVIPQVRKNAFRVVLPYLVQASTLAPLVLFILSLVYATPSDIQLCAADRQWLRMFDNKDAAAIRGIQSRLQCCGYNSMHDRAWPFPSRDNDARVCERTQGYAIACGGVWQREETTAARWTAIASLLNWLMVLLTVANFPEGEGQIRLPQWSTRSPRLIAEHANDEEAGDEYGAPRTQSRTQTDLME